MKLRTIAVAVSSASTLAFASPALGSSYLVTGTADVAAGPCVPQGEPDIFTCPSLRQAVLEANDNPAADDTVVLGPGIYQVTQGELVLQTGVSLIGTGARSTVIRSPGLSRILHVPVGATEVLVGGLTLDGGFVTGDRGGNLLNEGEADLFQVAITGGLASGGSGAGISNYGGDLTINESLISDNDAGSSGGGINNEARSGTPATLHVDDSTIAGNGASAGAGAGIATGSPGNSVTLNHVTFSQNFPGGALNIAVTGQDVSTRGSIFADNASNPNCPSALKPADDGFNVDSGTSCAFAGQGSVSAVDPQLSPGLTNAGGPTDLFTIAPASPAANIVSPCGSGLDQRGYLRDQNFLAACDAGAYEIGGQQIVPDPPPLPPVPTPPPPPVQTPAPTPAPTPPPVANKSVAATPVSGTVLIKVKGKFVPLSASVITNGSEIDARKGRVTITTSTPGDKADFFDGIFKVSQSGGITTLSLSEKLTGCPKAGKSSAGTAAKKPKSRKLWGEGKGKFRTKGSYSAATIRGTKWLVTDACTTTTTKVTEGSVDVRDLVKNKTTLVRKGKSYVARARK
jgi:hypothetical protein